MDVFHHMLSSNADVQIFKPNTGTTTNQWSTWVKPRGCTMVNIVVIGCGGSGGSGAVGANSTAAGGGGGGSGGQTAVTIPAAFLPDTLFVSVPVGGVAVASRVAVFPETTAQSTLAYANNGGTGGNATGATAGAAGAAAAIAAITSMPLAGLGQYSFFIGQAGIIGGVAVAGGNITIPATGLTVTGGAGGGGLPAAAAAGTAGGNITGVGQFPTLPGGAAQATATSPANNGSNGLDFAFRGLGFALGGAGGGSSHGTATGAGLKGGDGGKGGLGCGGGGGGGCLTGGVAGIGGKGGDGEVIIIAW